MRRRRGGAAILAILLIGALGSCSLQNREGPDVSCADLECGRINACREGIIASCADGVHLLFHVCSTSDEDEICDADWQTESRFRCDEHDIECEGCRPEKPGCP